MVASAGSGETANGIGAMDKSTSGAGGEVSITAQGRREAASSWALSCAWCCSCSARARATWKERRGFDGAEGEGGEEGRGEGEGDGRPEEGRGRWRGGRLGRPAGRLGTDGQRAAPESPCAPGEETARGSPGWQRKRRRRGRMRRMRKASSLSAMSATVFPFTAKRTSPTTTPCCAAQPTASAAETSAPSKARSMLGIASPMSATTTREPKPAGSFNKAGDEDGSSARDLSSGRSFHPEGATSKLAIFGGQVPLSALT